MDSKRFRNISMYIPDAKIRIEEIRKVYLTQKGLAIKNPKLTFLSWKIIAINRCPTYLKNYPSDWIAFIVEFRKQEKEQEEIKEILKASETKQKVKSEIEKESVSSKVKKFVKKSLFGEDQLEFNF
ncbi:MAG: hypothetical protein WAV23_02470 [Minisyncoccia bacterium]